MAKLKAPLMSLGASGAIGKTLVFFPWKGIDAVREYVVPANPKSDAQIIQRAFITQAVLLIHDNQAPDSYPFTTADKSGYSRDGSNEKTPRTWFNQAVKIMVDCQVDEQDFGTFRAALAEYLAATTATAFFAGVGEAAMNGDVFYGTSKTAMLSSVAGNVSGNLMTATLTDLVIGTTYYWQWRATAVPNKAVCRSGIYVYKHEAP